MKYFNKSSWSIFLGISGCVHGVDFYISKNAGRQYTVVIELVTLRTDSLES